MTLKGLSAPRPGDRDGQLAIRPTAGPMARSVEDLELVMRVWCGAHTRPKPMWELDCTVPQLPWRASAAASSFKKMKFGYFVSDGFFEPAPACKRVIHETAAKLRNAGHTLVEVKFEELYEVSVSYFGLMAAEGGMQGFLDGLEGESLHPMYRALFVMANLPAPVRALAWRLLSASGMPRLSDLLRKGCGCDTYEYWQRVADRDELRKSMFQKWEALELDAIICPAIGLPAWPHGMSELLNPVCSYTFVWNNLHCPAGVLPAGTVKLDEEAYEGGAFKDILVSDAATACRGSAGLPVNVQVVTLPFRDEECIRAMKELERVLGFVAVMPRHAPQG